MSALVFDLGDTLVEYEGLPMSWVDHYPEALGRLAAFLRIQPAPAQIEAACRAVEAYNTRLHPRQDEVPFARILGDICGCFSTPTIGDDEGAARAFFSVFRQRLRCFPDSQPVLAALRKRGIQIGVFTDIPYGMPRSLVLEDVHDAGLDGWFDVIVTSGDVGFRKPMPATLAHVAGKLGRGPTDIAYVGNERKDIDAAKKFGCAAILLDRLGVRPAWGQDGTITSLTELLGEQKITRLIGSGSV